MKRERASLLPRVPCQNEVEGVTKKRGKGGTGRERRGGGEGPTRMKTKERMGRLRALLCIVERSTNAKRPGNNENLVVECLTPFFFWNNSSS